MKLRVRTGRHYPVGFSVDLGQRNAQIIRKPQTPLRRFLAWADAFGFYPGPGWDLIHTINAVPLLTRKPYIVTFEDYMPRVPEDRYVAWLERCLQRRLLSDRCLALLAMSQYALRQFRHQNRAFPGISKLAAKTEVLYPAVELRRTSPKKQSGKLKLLFVGKDWLQKGVPAILRAHARLLRENLPVETTIVSTLRWDAGGYFGPTKRYDAQPDEKLLEQPGLHHYRELPNSDILRLMEEADFFVFPTFHDTFGFAPLEALSCGTPVLANDTCAQPEIVSDGECGFLLPFENDGVVGKWRWMYRTREPGYDDAYRSAIDRLADAITMRLIEFWEGKGDYEAMSAAAIERVKSRFDRNTARDRLEELYERCR